MKTFLCLTFLTLTITDYSYSQNRAFIKLTTGEKIYSDDFFWLSRDTFSIRVDTAWYKVATCEIKKLKIKPKTPITSNVKASETKLTLKHYVNGINKNDSVRKNRTNHFSFLLCNYKSISRSNMINSMGLEILWRKKLDNNTRFLLGSGIEKINTNLSSYIYSTSYVRKSINYRFLVDRFIYSGITFGLEFDLNVERNMYLRYTITSYTALRNARGEVFSNDKSNSYSYYLNDTTKQTSNGTVSYTEQYKVDTRVSQFSKHQIVFGKEFSKASKNQKFIFELGIVRSNIKYSYLSSLNYVNVRYSGQVPKYSFAQNSQGKYAGEGALTYFSLSTSIGFEF